MPKKGDGKAEAGAHAQGGGREGGQVFDGAEKQVGAAVGDEGEGQGGVFAEPGDDFGHEGGGGDGDKREAGEVAAGEGGAVAEVVLQVARQYDDGGKEGEHAGECQGEDGPCVLSRGRCAGVVGGVLTGVGGARDVADAHDEGDEGDGVDGEGGLPAGFGEQAADKEEDDAAAFDGHALQGDHVELFFALPEAGDEGGAGGHDGGGGDAEQEAVGQQGDFAGHEWAGDAEDAVCAQAGDGGFPGADAVGEAA